MDYYDADVLVVGAGFSGLSFARRYAEQHPGKRVCIIEKRDHIGGNCFDFVDGRGFFVQKYGPHVFHTNNDVVWNFLSEFTDWLPYKHKVIAQYGGDYYPVPINRNTINKFYGVNLGSEEEVRDFLDTVKVDVGKARNSRDVVVSRFGEDLYNAFIRHYTKKQWGLYPEELPRSVLERLPIRYGGNDFYYDANYQGIPSDGFTRLFERMVDLSNISVFLGVDFLAVKDDVSSDVLVVNSMRIDEFFNFEFGALPYRFSRFEFEELECDGFQPNSVVNYTEPEPDFIRSTEFKKLYFQDIPGSVVCREYTGSVGVPTYPVPAFGVGEAVSKYLDIVPANMRFIGRLGLHRYIDMDTACASALDLAEELK
ncbi:MAG: NAD(P)-binding protein [Candidatus Altiarchaeota archaeon]|nr:NAD(P)-binding protein [Candidatus Altiarchaeota archaeon]